MEGVAKVHKEGGTVPVEMILYERIREVGAMKQVGCSDPNGVGRPGLKVGVFDGQVMGRGVSKTKECDSV